MRVGVLHPELVEAVREDLAALSVLVTLLLEEAALVRLLEAGGGRLLERRVAAEDDARRRGERRVDDRLWSNEPADAPAGRRERLCAERRREWCGQRDVPRLR